MYGAVLYWSKDLMECLFTVLQNEYVTPHNSDVTFMRVTIIFLVNSSGFFSRAFRLSFAIALSFFARSLSYANDDSMIKIYQSTSSKS